MPAAQTRSSASKQGPSLGAGSGGASDDEVVSQVGSLDGKDTVEPSRVRTARKRHREGSTEPLATDIAPPSNSLPELATKKNRIEEPCDDEASDENEAVIKPSTEPSVDETREKVEKLSHEEGEKESELKTIHEESNKDHVKDKMESNTGDEDDNVQVVEMGQKRKMEMRVPSTSSITPDDVKRHKEGEPSEPPTTASTEDMEVPKTASTESSSTQVSETPTNDTTKAAPTPVKKPQATFGSFSGMASPLATTKPTTSALSGSAGPSCLSSDITEKIKEANHLGSSIEASSNADKPTNAPVKKPQATFGAFSSSASPFSAVKHTSAFASQPVASSSNATAHSPSPFASSIKSSSAFGSWSSGGSASASPFATPLKNSGAATTEKNSTTEAAAKAEGGDGKPRSTFGDILANSGSGPAEEKTTVDLEEQELHTGEEDEDTVYQIRAKLYVMDGSAWKERGTGALRVNVDKKRKDSAPRLVMRAEGVLRVILNVAMFSGMHIELTDKYVRTVVYEDGQARPIMIRTGSTKSALELHDKLEQYVPIGVAKTESKGGDKGPDAKDSPEKSAV